MFTFLKGDKEVSVMRKPGIEETVWYVLRVHNKSMEKVMKRLDELRVRTFVPMCPDVVTEKGRRVKKPVPALPGFVFIHSNVTAITRLMESECIPLSFYYSHYSHIQNDALWVGEREMDEFMRAVSAYDRCPHVHPCGAVTLRRGERVRVLSGPLEGVEGDYLQLRRGQKKRLVLTLADLLVVDLTLSPDDLIEIIESPR